MMSADLPPLRRTMLYVPGHLPTAIEAARGSVADVVCLDLEDNVPPTEKAFARDTIAAALRTDKFAALEVIVRINPSGSEYQPADLAMLREAEVDGILVPKVEDVGTVARVRAGSGNKPVWCQIETAAGLVAVERIAAAAGVQALVVGAADLAHGLGIPTRDAAAGMLLHGARIVAAARAFGLSAIEGITAAADSPNPCGFDGRSTYSGQDVAAINQAFSPSREDVVAAHAALDRPYAYGDHLVFARRLLRLAERAALRSG